MLKLSRKIISTILLLSVIILSNSVFAYYDCNDESVMALTELKVLSGYEDGTFKPTSFLSRAEFTKIISIVTGGSETEKTEEIQNVFSDVDNNHWAINYINHCKELKLVNGYEDGTFDPDKCITIAEAIKICLSAAGYNVLITEEGDNWYESWLKLAYEYKIMDTKDMGVGANREISRVEMAQLLYRTINLPLCKLSGYRVIDGVLTPMFDFADETVDKNGREKPFASLLTTYLQ